MDWTFLLLLAGLWLLSPIILLIALVIARHQVRMLRGRLAVTPGASASVPGPSDPPPSLATAGGQSRYAAMDLENLTLLRLELQRLLDAGELSEDRHRQLADELDRLWENHLGAGGAEPGNELWQRRRALGWLLLAQAAANPPGPPPWSTAVPAPPAPRVAGAPPPAAVPEKTPPVMPLPAPAAWTVAPLEPLSPPSLAAPRAPNPDRPLVGQPFSQPAAPLARPAPQSIPELEVAGADDWRPTPPSPLEKALQTLSGWPKLIAPFLAQNVGWFVGGFCFIAGALFLIANTSGFVNALVVFASLFGASAFLVWAGYQFRRKRPELKVASSMLLALGMLLAPLVLAVAVRLVVASRGDPLLAVVGLGATAATLAAFAWAAHLSSALMDRVLLGRYAWLLTGLGALQLAAPLAGFAPDWRVLMLLHALLLGLLGYGLWAFSNGWLQRLFVDRRLTTYYAAGMLVYTATVSFVHLTWLWPEPLPDGYAGPFLMALCALLLPVDAAFKEWVNKYTFLSRFTFVLYGLSAVAVAAAFQAIAPLLLTLFLGALLYGWMTWRYRSLPPLYLLLGCVAGLYGSSLSHWLPPAWHGLASQPGLLGLVALGRWADSRWRAIALQCFTVFALLLVGVAAWSAWWSEPGWLGFATFSAVAGLAYLALRSVLALADAEPRWSYGGYGVAVLASVAMAYLPGGFGLDWAMRTAYGWLALAALWSALGLHDSRQSANSRRVWVTGALANVLLALALVGLVRWPTLLGRLEPIVLLVLAGALLSWLSVGLRWRALFYGALVCAAGVGVLVKRGYFPAPGTGLVEFVLAAALWVLLWRLDWRLRARRALRGDEADSPPSDSVDTPASLSLADLIRQPLEQAMALLWAVGLVQLGLRFLAGGISAKWPVTAGLGVVTGWLLIGHFHLFRWMALPFALGLAGLLAGLERVGFTPPWLGAAGVLYALLVWRAGVALLAQPSTQRLAQVLGFTVPGGAGGSRLVEESLHGCAFLVAALPVAASPALALLGSPAPELLPALGLGLLLFLLAGWHYRSERHAYAALVTLTVTAWLLDAGWMSSGWLGLGQPLLNVLLGAGMALIRLGLEPEGAAPLGYWRRPLRWSSTLLYLLALAGALLGGLAGDVRLPVLLALLCLALFPVARPWPDAPAWRGVGLALLSSALAWSLAGWADFAGSTEIWIAVGWGYALWFDGNLLLPRWNIRQPAWAVAPEFWPLLGLACVLAGSVLGFTAGVLSLAAALAALTPYLFLLLRNTAWPGMAWLAVATLTVSGLLAVGDATGWSPPVNGHGVVASGYVGALLWVNALFVLIPLWRRYGQALAHRLGWRQNGLAEPLFWSPFAALLVILGCLGWLEFGLFWSPSRSEPLPWGLVAVTFLLAATAAHAFWLRRQWPQAHGLLLASLVLAGAVFLMLGLSPAWLPLAVALWGGALLLVWRYGPHRLAIWRLALEQWLTALPVAILALLFVMADFEWATITVTLLVLAMVLLAQGWWQSEAARLKLGLLLALIASHTVWLAGTAGLAGVPLAGLAPWYALQAVLLLLALMAVRPRLEAWLNGVATGVDEGRASRIYELEQTLKESLPRLLSLGLLWLGLHAYAVLAYRGGWGSTPWRFGATTDPLAAGAALLLLAGLSGVRAWRRPHAPNGVYATALLLGSLAAYGRLVLLGLTPFTVADTAALMVAAYAALLLQRFTASRPLYHLALVLPLLALATVPWQLASPWAGGALLAAAVLYLSLAGTLRNPLPLYLGVLALNGAIYLWAPLWAARYGLWQFYIIPAAVSVLALVHLHRRELRPGVSGATRLAALSALYAGAGLDVFLRPELWVFVLALGLALAGVILGVALRVRAFLYAGVAFLVLNVAGQLIRFYPEQSLSRALILIGLGALITVGMVLFNLKKEEIMRRIRIMYADLAAWE
ncbi:MAG TPA: hypothetical protein PK880_08665 [Candidatus Competibacter sp.]|nr:hypothetical protein [Candidatus Competibacteraceae bacterium]HRC72592.1 hypothetical protein [Candidatus Competibacter sp.]